jgi:hypothetical protein
VLDESTRRRADRGERRGGASRNGEQRGRPPALTGPDRGRPKGRVALIGSRANLSLDAERPRSRRRTLRPTADMRIDGLRALGDGLRPAGVRVCRAVPRQQVRSVRPCRRSPFATPVRLATAHGGALAVRPLRAPAKRAPAATQGANLAFAERAAVSAAESGAPHGIGFSGKPSSVSWPFLARTSRRVLESHCSSTESIIGPVGQ